MKILKLVAENVKRLHAVEITPGEASLVMVGGKNGAGKSSVLDSIAYAMGGERLVPSEPIRAGESEAKVVIDLGEFVVTRKFKREKIVVPAQQLSGQPGDFAPERTTWGETKSTLTVTNKDGAKYPSPQAILDKLLGRLTFDPLAFAHDDPKRQDETLRRLVSLDVSGVEARRKEAFDKRAMLRKSLSIKEAQLLNLTFFKDAPADEIPIAAISEEMLKAEEARAAAEQSERESLSVEAEVVRIATAAEKVNRTISETEALLLRLKAEATGVAQQAADAGNRLEAARGRTLALRALVPDAAALRARLTEVEGINVKVRANRTYQKAAEELDDLGNDVSLYTTVVENAEEEKKKMLAAAVFPVEGLGLSDAGVTFGGLPFGQASSSEQLRVSVMVGLALNPTLKVLLVRNGNMLDNDSLKAVGELAAEAKAQVWVEWVTGKADDVAVMLVEGEVEGKEEKSALAVAQE